MHHPVPSTPEVLEPVYPGAVWERVDPDAAGYDAYAGAYSGMGAYGQYITVLPELDLVIAQKTDPNDGSVSCSNYLAAVQTVVQAHDLGGVYD